MFRDHELIVRTDGHVRYLRLGAGAQRKAAVAALGVAGVWLTGTAALIGWQAWTSHQTRDMEQRAVAVAQAEVRVAAERRSAEQIASDVETRQKQLESLFKSHFGDDPEAAAALAEEPAPATAQPASAEADVQPVAAVIDPSERLKSTGARQQKLVSAMTDAAARRTARAESALAAVGLRPTARLAQGGPFLPWRTAKQDAPGDPDLKRLATTLMRMEQVESLLVAVPSGSPADGMQITSGFGTRYDPFNGARAIHAGIDFRGPHGSPIRAAAPGRVSFVGQKSGYGNVVEVDHGHGLLTRYAHLAGFNAQVGDEVQSGQAIARMGSTGRSTGTHLHFEVRVNGEAVNPRRFLEANANVLEIKADARERVLGRVSAS
ncbi:M23 family metallopeptidase [Sandaracinobacter neustonicus]|uniref:M23 family metallopeptidase n=1 Tax=Sandaracinobacter neustonicus TaxID=1715348 RepID=UPI001F254D2C|nr:M23 family metallopeptidase [Sandaracinobacter neustonicus]